MSPNSLIGVSRQTRRARLEQARTAGEVPLTEAVQRGHAFVFDALKERLSTARKRLDALLVQLANRNDLERSLPGATLSRFVTDTSESGSVDLIRKVLLSPGITCSSSVRPASTPGGPGAQGLARGLLHANTTVMISVS